jgi:hypothetical protein
MECNQEREPLLDGHCISTYYSFTTVLFPAGESPNKRYAQVLKNKALRLVPGGGVEPPRAEARRILSPLRLPVPPSRLYLQVPDFTTCLWLCSLLIQNDECATV